MTHNEKRQSATREGLIGLGGKINLYKTAILIFKHQAKTTLKKQAIAIGLMDGRGQQNNEFGTIDVFSESNISESNTY